MTTSCDLTKDVVPEHIWSPCLTDFNIWGVCPDITEKKRMVQFGIELEARAKQACVEWLAGQKFSSFITLTLDDKKTLRKLGKEYHYGTPPINYTAVGVQRFTNNLNRVLNYLGGCPDDDIGKSVWVMEKQLRGAWHAHIISTCPIECSKIISKVWKLGFCDVELFDSKSQQSQYLMKYVHKSSFLGLYSRELDTYPMDYHNCPGLNWAPLTSLDKRRINDGKMRPAQKKFVEELNTPTVDVWEVIRRAEKRLNGRPEHARVST